jgi:hypothetical protein
MTCVLPVTGSDGITRMTRSCVDGPVFRGEQVRWDDIGTIPFDAFGAPGWEARPRRAAQAGRGTAPVAAGPADGSGPGSGASAAADRSQDFDGSAAAADSPADAAQAAGAPASAQPKARPAKTSAARAAGARGRAARRQGHGG